ncbi:dTDP-glucose 4,6-dehydratase [Zeaxanthinibacter sp. PT1]|uniref:dTDP-glucose 4,6-dehydratase n=1 Tax=Zeaxanthinibacter TaxID=561554 RepID=UPI00234A0256|nr:dTDP-glucose 4,6-dehydratase [Zeaxanthinibacter sp. PT1]MDC6350619.1 dTDP-glucose 4,6-dehydratase [Zeaxanthinibacter sp. PT1]
MKILITGGAGFIGSHLVRRMLTKYPEYSIHNLDALTYAGNLYNLEDIEGTANYTFHKADIRDEDYLKLLFNEHLFDAVIHLAAESHVDRSIEDPMVFLDTNVRGTANLLEAAMETWSGNFTNKLFYHVSTDEVYGSLGAEGYFTEDSPYSPNSPYAASKASSDHFVRAYGETYGIPYIISNCSNNYGPNQFPEKLLPLCLQRIMSDQPVPIYGDGKNTRDWLFVEDHVAAIDLIFHEAKRKETYNIGSNNEWKNIDLVKQICTLMDKKLNRPEGSSENLIRFVKDRPGHDQRYAIDASKLMRETGWKPEHDFESGLSKTIDWYVNNQTWVEQIRSGEYRNYKDN